MFTATINFDSRQDAQEFASAWSRWSLLGCSLSATQADGKTAVVLDGVTPAGRQWINNKIGMMNARKDQAAA